MATINAVGSPLKGTSGTGSFAGTTSPVFTTPRTATVYDSSGNQVLALQGSTTCRLNISTNNGTSPVLSVAGSSGGDLGFQTQLGGIFRFTTSSSSLVMQILTGNGIAQNNIYFPSSLLPCDITFPGAASQTLCADSSNSGSITTAPPASSTSSIVLGSAFQNPYGYDILATVYLSVTAATADTISLGVGPTSSPTQSNILSGLTVAGLTVIPVPIYIPSQYYALLTVGGSVTASISGQIQIPV